MEASGGIVLLLATAAALIWANSPWQDSYHTLWHTQVTLGIGHFSLSESRHEWINDGLMSIFFFLVGLEIKREVLIGELSSMKQAIFPFLAAAGGSAVPAVIYLVATHSTDLQRGWAIPMATDIAFALGALALLGNRIPVGLKVFVTALAIVDDIFCVLVIAVFYTDHIYFLSLALAFLGVALSCLANWLGVRQPVIYGVIAVFVWLAVLKSGVHATIAGVLMAFTIPATTFIDRREFLDCSRLLLDEVEAAGKHSAQEHNAVHALEQQCELIQSPLHRIEHQLQPWVSYFIMPVFALANAGVHVLGNFGRAMADPVAIGVALGLFIGKPIGITASCWLAVRFKLASPPAGVNWKQIFGASWLCAIGFTMSLFIAALAFGGGDELDLSKMGTLAASLSAGIAGALVLRKTAGRSLHPRGESQAAANTSSVQG
jgi:NhaA family Na+:H+ antiporter